MIKGLAHICFTVKNLEETIRFYCGILGMKEAFDYVNEDGRKFGVYIHAGNRNFLEIFERPHDAAAQHQSYQHFSMEVENIQEMVNKLNSAGIKTTEIGRGKDRSWGLKFSDPDGNTVELQEYTDESKQVIWLKTCE